MEKIKDNKNNIFMSIAVAIVFIMQSYTQIEQKEHASAIEKLDKTTLTEDQIDVKINKALLENQKAILEEELAQNVKTNQYFEEVLEVLTELKRSAKDNK